MGDLRAVNGPIVVAAAGRPGGPGPAPRSNFLSPHSGYERRDARNGLAVGAAVLGGIAVGAAIGAGWSRLSVMPTMPLQGMCVVSAPDGYNYQVPCANNVVPVFQPGYTVIMRPAPVVVVPAPVIIAPRRHWWNRW